MLELWPRDERALRALRLVRVPGGAAEHEALSEARCCGSLGLRRSQERNRSLKLERAYCPVLEYTV